MDTARLWLAALLILAPPAAYTVGVIIYNRRRRALRNARRPTVADIKARIAADENAAGTAKERQSSPLPRGWHWPSRDHDRL